MVPSLLDSAERRMFQWRVAPAFSRHARLPLALLGGFLVIAALINGAALEMEQLAWTTTLQELVPNDKLGRVVSIDNMGSFALLPIGFAVAGWATEAYGAQVVFLVGGFFTALITGAALLIPTIRKLD